MKKDGIFHQFVKTMYENEEHDFPRRKINENNISVCEYTKIAICQVFKALCLFAILGFALVSIGIFCYTMFMYLVIDSNYSSDNPLNVFGILFLGISLIIGGMILYEKISEKIKCPKMKFE